MYIPGLSIRKSTIYHDRYECYFYGKKGKEIKLWLRNCFGEQDDMIYSYEEPYMNPMCYKSLINDMQLTALLLKFQ